MPASNAALGAKSNNFSTGHFKVVIDGAQITAFIKSVEGGLVSGQVVEEPIGQNNIRGRHLGTREIEPIQIEFGMAGAKWALDILNDFIVNRKTHRFNGEVVHADANMVAQYRFTFTNALLTELTLPKMDATTKDSAMCKVKLQPQDVTFQLGDGKKLNQDSFGRQKAWNTANFRMNFDNMAKDNSPHITSVESMTIKLGYKTMQLSNFFRPDVIPTKVDMPKLSVNLPLLRANKFIDWYQKSVGNQLNTGIEDAGHLEGTSQGADGYETTCSLEFLDNTLKETLYEVDLAGVGMEKFTIAKSEANGSGVKMAKFDFYVTDMKVKSNGGGFK